MKTAFAVLTLVVLVGCNNGGPADPSEVTASPTPTVSPSPSPSPTQIVLKLAAVARQGGSIVREVQADTFFVAEVTAVCGDSTLDCPRLASVVWSATGFCDFYSDITSPQVFVKCLGGGTARLEAYSRLYNTSGVLQIGVNIPN